VTAAERVTLARRCRAVVTARKWLQVPFQRTTNQLALLDMILGTYRTAAISKQHASSPTVRSHDTVD
jgi:hypothetical protein